MWVNKQMSEAIECFFKSVANVNCLAISILLNIFFYVLEKKEL